MGREARTNAQEREYQAAGVVPEYQIVQKIGHEAFVAMVNRKIAEGFVPVGGVFAFPAQTRIQGALPGVAYVQALMRVPPQDEERIEVDPPASG